MIEINIYWILIIFVFFNFYKKKNRIDFLYFMKEMGVFDKIED